MFDWFDKVFKRRDYSIDNRTDMEKIGDDMNKVIPFPKGLGETAPPMPEVEPPKEKPATIFYRIGTTDKNRISFQMGYSEITMNRAGVENLIQQLQVFRDQLTDEPEND